MKRDPQLELKILEKLESLSDGEFFDGVPDIEGYDKQAVSYHMANLDDRGLLNEIHADEVGVFGYEGGLSFDGHEYLDELRLPPRDDAQTHVNELAIIELPTGHKALLRQMVEAVRRVTPSERRRFILAESKSSSSLIHPGAPGNIPAYGGDLDDLADVGLVRKSFGSGGGLSFDVTPLGVKYYGYLKLAMNEPVERVERELHSLIDGADFSVRHQTAYRKWKRAEERLWSSNSSEELTAIGHYCREAIQEFADSLIQHHNMETESPKVDTVARIRSFLDTLRSDSEVSTKKLKFLDALLVYWGTVIDLIQRQEHGALKEREDFNWEDARLVVFQSLVVMYEIDQVSKRH